VKYELTLLNDNKTRDNKVIAVTLRIDVVCLFFFEGSNLKLAGKLQRPPNVTIQSYSFTHTDPFSVCASAIS